MRRFYPSKQSSNFQLVTGILDYHVDISKSFSHSNARSSERRAHQGYRNLKSTEQHHPLDVRVRALVPLLSPLPSLSLCGINHYTGPRNVNLRRINTDKYETVQQSRKGEVLKEPSRPRSVHHQPRNSRGKERSRRRGDIYFQPVPRVAATSSMQGDDEGKGTGSLFPPSASLFRLPYPPPLSLLSFSSSFLRRITRRFSFSGRLFGRSSRSSSRFAKENWWWWTGWRGKFVYLNDDLCLRVRGTI